MAIYILDGKEKRLVADVTGGGELTSSPVEICTDDNPCSKIHHDWVLSSNSINRVISGELQSGTSNIGVLSGNYYLYTWIYGGWNVFYVDYENDRVLEMSNINDKHKLINNYFPNTDGQLLSKLQPLPN